MVEESMEERAYRVHGRVQGVSFRWWTRSAAAGLGLTGAVRNAADGTVEVRAWGPASRLAALERALETGPRAARVQRVERIPCRGGVPRDEFRIEL